MIMKRVRKIKTFTVNKSVADTFLKTYPMMMSRFLERAMFLALKDKAFFGEVFFGVKDADLKEAGYD